MERRRVASRRGLALDCSLLDFRRLWTTLSTLESTKVSSAALAPQQLASLQLDYSLRHGRSRRRAGFSRLLSSRERARERKDNGK